MLCIPKQVEAGTNHPIIQSPNHPITQSFNQPAYRLAGQSIINH
jgi:hypothetical protein